MSDSYRITQTTRSISSIADKNSFQGNGQPINSSPEDNGQQADFQEIRHASGERQLKLKELSSNPSQFAAIQAARWAARQQIATLIQGLQQRQVNSPSADEQQIASRQSAQSAMEIASASLVTSMKEMADKILGCKNKESILCDMQANAETTARQGVIQTAVEGRDTEIIAGGGADATRPRQMLGSQNEIQQAMAEATVRTVANEIATIQRETKAAMGGGRGFRSDLK